MPASTYFGQPYYGQYYPQVTTTSTSSSTSTSTTTSSSTSTSTTTSFSTSSTSTSLSTSTSVSTSTSISTSTSTSTTTLPIDTKTKPRIVEPKHLSGPKVKTSAARSNISVIGVKANVEKPQSKIKQPNKVKMAGILGAQPTRTQIIKKKIAIRQIRLR